MNVRDRRTVLLTAAVLLVAALACTPPTQEPASPMPTTAQSAAETATSTSQPPATDEPPPTTEEECTLGSGFVSDVTVPDDTEFAPGESFIKTWRLRNTGTCPWEPGTVLVFSSGDQMGGPASVTVGPVVPGATTDVSVNQTAPMAPGTYRGNWQLQTPAGVRFGAIPYLRIVVAGAGPPPTATSTPTTAPSTCVPPDPALEPILTHAEGLGYDLGCPTLPAFSLYGAFQEFWEDYGDSDPNNDRRSLMIWRSDNKDIYVIVGEDANASNGRILAYTDFWDESQPSEHPDCLGMTPPSGLQRPIRGFGKIWCEEELLYDVGFAWGSESAVTLLVQWTQGGLLLQVSDPGGYLIALDFRAVYAVTLPSGP